MTIFFLILRMTMQETQYLQGFNYATNKVAFEWQYMNSDYIVRQEYLTYDINSLIADVGGYLGLLLGQSIYGLYKILISGQDYKKGMKGCLGLYP